MSQEEQGLIYGAVHTALCFGTGVYTAAMEAIKDEGYEWTQAHEQHTFEIAQEIEASL